MGNVMIDTLRATLRAGEPSNRPFVDRLGSNGAYAVLTLHRPVERRRSTTLAAILERRSRKSPNELPVVFPVHPRTRTRLRGVQASGTLAARGLRLVDRAARLPRFPAVCWPAPRLVLTDCGGMQEETTALGVPCLTLRENTERPITVTEGTNTIVGADRMRNRSGSRKILRGHGKQGRVPKYWDGKAAEQIVQVLREHRKNK